MIKSSLYSLERALQFSAINSKLIVGAKLDLFSGTITYYAYRILNAYYAKRNASVLCVTLAISHKASNLL